DSQSKLRGAIHAKGELTLANQYSFKSGEFIYDEEAVKNLWKLFSCQALPNEPDETLNNSTLLGIDDNRNGVRDDVEIFIIGRYKDEHKIVTEIAFQWANAYQRILNNPLDTEINHKSSHDAMDCNFYFKSYAEYYNDPILVNHYIDEEFRNLQFNRKSRVKAYMEYDAKLSGGVYESTKTNKLKEKCNFDVTSLLGGE
ncbi:MAG: hypothetical protein U9P72_07910, partial [Campylobacterota bacterium]|nr:hypothetical protein [Campylobacterota bacterium]